MTRINIMDYFDPADGSPFVRGKRTHNISKAITRAREAHGGITCNFFLPPVHEHGVDAYTCDPVPEGAELRLTNAVVIVPGADGRFSDLERLDWLDANHDRLRDIHGQMVRSDGTQSLREFIDDEMATLQEGDGT